MNPDPLDVACARLARTKDRLAYALRMHEEAAGTRAEERTGERLTRAQSDFDRACGVRARLREAAQVAL